MKESLFWLIIISTIWFANERQKREPFIPPQTKSSVLPSPSLGNASQMQITSLIHFAQSHLGTPYKYGTIGPKTFDCSGFVYTVYKQNGIIVPRTSLDQSQIEGNKIPRNKLKIGDMVFFDTSLKGFVNHSGIYLGKDKFIHASSGKAYAVTISDMNAWYKDTFKWGKRPIK
jgi:cell wall-associated NlpC family hydrolase